VKLRVLTTAACLLAWAGAAQAQTFTEAFDDITTLPGSGWFMRNNSAPIGLTGWSQGASTVFPAHQGAPTAYISANFNNGAGLATISNWLLTPPVMLSNGSSMTFWTRSVGSTFPDRLQVRMSTAGNGTDVGTGPTDVGTFTTLLIDINPTYQQGVYPNVWTLFTATVTGVPTPTLGRFAFRYFVENSGPSGANGDYIGIDTAEYVPAASVAPLALAVDAGGNNVLEPNETAVSVAPTWSNTSPVNIASLTGTLSNLTGPAGPTYTIDDNAAAYGALNAGAQASCTSQNNCYAVTVAGATRPVVHWDATATESVTTGPTTKDWTLHVGGSFTDVASSSPFYRFIETLLHKGVTGGCTATAYCPLVSTTREQMSVFVLIAKEGAGYSPAACGATTMFSDVPASSPFCRFIEELARRGVVAGCGPGVYCPTAPVSREQMAVFVLRTLDPALNPPACGTPVFADVPASSPFCRWIEELARRGVVTGCGGGNYCPTAPVSREQMGVFLSATFGLTLYGI
jgi:hypothetical protein